jgi:hypothetical protein
VHNTKSVPIERLRIVDQIPVSQDAQIEVRLVAPALTLPAEGGGGTSKLSSMANTNAKAPQVLNVGKGVVAQWDGTDEPECDVEALGRERKVNWVCAVPAQGKINLALEWEVTAPASLQVVGL